MSTHTRTEPELDALLWQALATEIVRQDAYYGRFTATVAGARLAVAVLEDETAEVRDSWRAERREQGWPSTRAELIQAAAVAVRAWRDLAPGSGTTG